MIYISFTNWKKRYIDIYNQLGEEIIEKNNAELKLDIANYKLKQAQKRQLPPRDKQGRFRELTEQEEASRLQ